ncbi:unnamed protein product [Allacma fusca]|uniref:MYND-type domain-containing protein n=1 Tax=Allacma fusca TaxID=39272 RepID=A0A8J2NRF7_9HEXA|nr:unnamed protein product [Allacma fusca]
MARYLYFIIAIAVITSYAKTTANADLVVETSNGLIAGSLELTRLNRTYHSFKGIPFAKPPVGELRFESPQPPTNWTGILNTTQFNSGCSQATFGSEDCLYLNVFSPKVDDGFSKAPLPVLVYIHGGFFQSVSAWMYEAGYILDEDVILVTINYRLHSLGFLNTADGLVKGNMGLKDMTMALQWVQENIGNFGGDAKRVTIFGQSAGGAAVHYLLLTNSTKGLFSKAISQSGVATKLWSIQPQPLESATLLAQRLNCSTNTTEVMVACLKRVDASLISRYSSLSGGEVKNDLEVFCPSVEVPSEDAFLTKHPYDIIEDGEAQRVPWISGSASGEGLLYINPLKNNATLVKEINENWAEAAPAYLYYNKTQNDLTALITDFYFGDEKIDFQKLIVNFTELWSDRLYISFTRNTAVTQAKFSPVYTYLFDYKENESNFAADHAEELFLLFPLSPKVGPDSKHFNMSRDLIKLWVQFAANESGLNFQDYTWDPIDVSGRNPIQYLYFSNDFNAVVDDPIKGRMDFWDDLDLYRRNKKNIKQGIHYCHINIFIPRRSYKLKIDMQQQQFFCQVCRQPADLKCAACRNIYYCSSQHQHIDWRRHEKECPPYLVTEHPIFGMQFVAARNLKAGKVLLQEIPALLSAPYDTATLSSLASAPCTVCSIVSRRGQTKIRCSKCTWPICSSRCEDEPAHAANECRLFSLKQITFPPPKKFDNASFGDLVMLIRAGGLKRRDPDAYEKLLTLQNEDSMPPIELNENYKDRLLGLFRSIIDEDDDFWIDEEERFQLLQIITLNRVSQELEIDQQGGAFTGSPIPIISRVKEFCHKIKALGDLIAERDHPVSRSSTQIDYGLIEMCENMIRQNKYSIVHPNHWVMQRASEAITFHSGATRERQRLMDKRGAERFLQHALFLLGIQDKIMPGINKNRVALQINISRVILLLFQRFRDNMDWSDVAVNLSLCIQMQEESLHFYTHGYSRTTDQSRRRANEIRAGLRESKMALEMVEQKGTKECQYESTPGKAFDLLHFIEDWSE